jgi:transcriptional regulator with XRE-family HTH domain
MEGMAARLKALRIKAGKDTGNLADAIGISGTWFDELEEEDGLLEDSLDLEQIRKLALLLNVGMAHLLTGSPLPPGLAPIDFKALARHLRRRLETEASLESLEERIGWDLGAFLKRPETEGWGQRVVFFQAVCMELKLDWLGVLAYGEALREE